MSRHAGGPTQGRAVEPDGNVHELLSGNRKEDPYVRSANERARELGLIPENARLTTDSDVELKYAMRMREQGVLDAALVINNPNGPCPGDLGCDALLPAMLGEGRRLTVYWPADDTRPGGAKVYEGVG